MKKAKVESQSGALRAELSELVERLLPAARQAVTDCAAKRARALLEGSDDDVDALDEAGYVARREVERFELRADNLTKEIAKVEAAELLEQKRRGTAYARRDAERFPALRRRRIEIAAEDAELARQERAILKHVGEKNVDARELGEQKIVVSIPEGAVVERFESPADQRADAELLKQKRQEAAAA
jgi:hypothetical protein